ncbi:MAG: aspartate--ammonia ligase [Pseudomonadota bacterium]
MKNMVYRPKLNLMQTEQAIKFVKDSFQQNLARTLKINRVSAPMAVQKTSGINDNLNGVEKPIGFKVKDIRNGDMEIVQSLAKWKRAALAEYKFKPGQGLYTDMNALRPDETLDHLHSIYVDQWDWEKIIKRQDRNVEFLKTTVKKIYKVIYETEKKVCKRYPALGKPFLPKNIYFVHSVDLEKKYPKLTPRQRENVICQEKKAVFIIGIGAPLKNGKPHDGRAPDYDDWWTKDKNNQRGLNGDIIVWYPGLNSAYELSSMGIRVDATSLKAQLKIRKKEFYAKQPYHQKLLRNKLPLSIGGGIGQSRLCMLFLRKMHIGEVQASVWPKELAKECKKKGIPLL